ncbi:P21-Rho-binding domain [Musa troglodytarum]|uniref:GDT1 family protein n=1 Tax=Musa troglodytarum TaxID=320322 RepID=A0A9E7K2F1_9LILI|nr:P21-Rho-binding domain [Musa troglodytarum]
MDRSGRSPGFGLSSIAVLLLIFLGSFSSLVLTQMLLHSLRKDEDASDGRVVSLDQTGLGLFDAFFASLSMIIVSEIGDETFIIAALMAMRHPKSIVLSGALMALVVMTVLSTGLGRIVPNLISRKHTNSAATVLYAFFGLRLLYIAWRSDSKTSQKKEMEEVEEKLESGQGKSTLRRFFSRFCTPIFLELATHKNAIGVAVGATLGHTICTSLAVVGGSMLASKISQKTVATIGGLLFLGERRMGKLVVLPFSASCVSRSGVAVSQSRPKRAQGRELEKQSTAKTKGAHRIQKLLIKSLKSLSQMFAVYEEEDEEREMEIGFPTDVQHVAHIGRDGFDATAAAMNNMDVKSWVKGRELLPLDPLSLQQFEAAMATLASVPPSRRP